MPGVGIALRGFGKAFKNVEKKADKISEKMIKEMISPKAIEKAKGYSKLVGGTIAAKTVMPSLSGTKKDQRVRKAEGGRTAAWQRKEGKNPSGGLNQKGRDSYKGGTLKAPTKSKTSGRRKSFCARMGGMKKKLTSAKTARDPDSRINKALRKWDC